MAIAGVEKGPWPLVNYHASDALLGSMAFDSQNKAASSQAGLSPTTQHPVKSAASLSCAPAPGQRQKRKEACISRMSLPSFPAPPPSSPVLAGCAWCVCVVCVVKR